MTGRALAVAGLLLLGPHPAAGWGLGAHRWVAEQAAARVEASCPALVRGHRRELATRAVEPDTVLKARFGRRERVRHFLDLDTYGAPPFRALPRDRARAEARWGRGVVERRGILPWHGATLAARLRDEIERRDWQAARRTAGYLAHYAADATMPLHATDNHDGQRTGQRGLHARIEARLVDGRPARFRRHAAQVAPRRPIAPSGATGALFAALEDAFTRVPVVLAADRAARRGTQVGSALYYRRLERDLSVPLGRQLGAAVALTVALWDGACRAARAAPEARRAGSAGEAERARRRQR